MAAPPSQLPVAEPFSLFIELRCPLASTSYGILLARPILARPNRALLPARPRGPSARLGMPARFTCGLLIFGIDLSSCSLVSGSVELACPSCGEGRGDLAGPPMAAAVSMASVASTSCLRAHLSAPCARRPTSSSPSRLGLGFRAGAGDLRGLVSPSFRGIQMRVRAGASAPKESAGVGIRAKGAKGDYLVQKVSARELDDILAHERSSPMVVDFYATWCGPCILLAQELEQLAVEYGDRVRFLKIDTDEEHELANQMEIRGLPTMVFVSPDTEKLAIRTEGLLSTHVIRDIIEKEL